MEHATVRQFVRLLNDEVALAGAAEETLIAAASPERERLFAAHPEWHRIGVLEALLDAARALVDQHQERSTARRATGGTTMRRRSRPRRALERGLPPQRVAGQVFDAIRDEKFYILTHPDWKPLVQMRVESILQDRNPA